MKHSRLVAGLAVAALGLAGCGGGGSDDAQDSGVSDLSATQLVAKAKKELAAADSVALTGQRSNGTTTVALDIDYVGDDATGTVTVGDIDSTLLTVDGKAFVKFGQPFYEQTFKDKAADAAALVGDRWITVDPADPNFTDLLSFLDREEFLGGVLTTEGTPKKAAGKTIDGTKTLGVKGAKGTLYVDAKTGRPVRIVPTDNPAEDVTFSYEGIDTPVAPAASDTVSLEELNQLG